MKKCLKTSPNREDLVRTLLTHAMAVSFHLPRELDFQTNTKGFKFHDKNAKRIALTHENLHFLYFSVGGVLSDLINV